MNSIVKLWQTTETNIKWLSLVALLYIISLITMEVIFGIIATLIFIILLITDSNIRRLF